MVKYNQSIIMSAAGGGAPLKAVRLERKIMPKFLMLGTLMAALAIAGNVSAASQNSGNGSAEQEREQVQTANQGEDTQVQTQTAAQTKANDDAVQSPAGTGTAVRQQDQQKLQDGSEAGGQVQEQERSKDQTGDQLKNQEKSAVAEQRRSQVASAVQEMLQVADRSGGIGEQVRVVAQAQNQNQEKLEASLEKVQSRSALLKFFIGPNYGEISNAEKVLAQNQEQISQLNELKSQVANQGDQQKLTEQIQVLEQANSQISASLGEAQKGFSLLGWAFKLFVK